MLNYLMTLASCKMSKKGALFVEYALILAFVVIVGTVLVGSSTGLDSHITSIINQVKLLLGNADKAASGTN